ncbi:DUF551 domain-containing protein [Achromobacter ruhlandii]|nr:DUF551 domain-containing protein [Achromobacter ruhlandii]MCV6799333.1 DUF551 domain-containing protein [Achromobacter ruhlandii]MCV6812799.1 DUF551 domain-containing protein [Achromobacter ruhlandii]MCV6821781.1 DUF551 domain-containing protein [Achromobacter ruhlandii]
MLNIPAGWKPIESAPKDGTEILAWRSDCGQFIASYTSADSFPMTQDELDAWDEETLFAKDWFTQWPQAYRLEGIEVPTHWMPLPAAPGSVSPSAPGDAQDERSPTHGMTLGERIAHVGGHTNAQGYVEFGSPMAVNALIQHVLRDIDWTRQDDDGAYQARYRLPGGQWSSWGHVVCGVKGHEQELRYLPSERRPAPAAGDALDAKRYRWLRDESQDLDLFGSTSPYVIEGQTTEPLEGEALDAAIDAALAAQVPQQGEA